MKFRQPMGFWAGLLSKKIQYLLDIFVLVGAFWLSYLLRFEFHIPESQIKHAFIQVTYVVLLQFCLLFLFGVYNFIWRYIGMAEIGSFLRASIWSFLAILLFRLGLPYRLQELRVPLSIIVLDTMLAFGGVLALRVLRRATYERYEKDKRIGSHGNGGLKAVLLVGAGRAGVMAAKEIQGRGDMSIEVKGFVDDDPQKMGSMIQGIRVVGATKDIPKLAKELDLDHVIITIAQAPRKDIRRIVEICEGAKVRVRIIPGLYELLGGKLEVSRIRDVQIEDLLGREQVQLDPDALSGFLRGKRVLVTGAGGSIGSEIARQVLHYGPSQLILLERAEFALFDIEQELLGRDGVDRRVFPVVTDVTDREGMRAIFERCRPEVVLHAAAHKHVPMMERNPIEAVKNNTFGTRVIGELAGEFGVETFVMISTDKAVRPSSVMGATKRLAEIVVQDLDSRWDTKYVAVRFGNVLGSAGSVIPIFRRQIQKGGPVTVTHPDMVRYFMTIPEAVQLVLQAGAMGEGGEIFILDMGEPVRILDLAKEMITLSGLKPFEDIDIAFSGMRPGEKLFEELGTRDEVVKKTRHPKIFIGRIVPYPEERVASILEELAGTVSEGDEAALRKLLKETLPDATISV